MCGICGIVRQHGDEISSDELIAMRDLIAHRGPDSAGYEIHRNVGLGHRRLRIIDLSEAGSQPMFNEDRSLSVVFNGEIYNYASLRSELISHGHVFRSQSDTEVLVHGYEQWGATLVQRLNGIFAFALHNHRTGQVFLARDHLGVKPLYYLRTPSMLAFSSEIKAFRALPEFQPRLNRNALTEYMLFRSVTDPETLFEGVKTVPPAHWMMVEADLTITTQRYWDVDLTQSMIGGGYDEQLDRTLNLLNESVEMQLMSDVPVGAQLSGGTDSSLVTALMVGQSSQPVRSYAVGFREGQSELPFAAKVSDHLHTIHSTTTISNEAFADQLDALAWHMDEPMTHANAAGVYWLCQQAKPSVTVLLTGEGADELFGGYHRYLTLQKSVEARRWLIPFAPFAGVLPVSGRLGKIRNALRNGLPALTARSTMFGGDGVAGLLDPASISQVLHERESIVNTARGAPWLSQALYYDLRTYLPPILMRQDKMSMAHGVETRVPFLNPRLVELAFRLPIATKLHGGEGKRVIKDIATRYVPADVVHRPKVGFSFPLREWLASPFGLGARLDELLSADSGVAEFLPRASVASLIAQRHQPGATDSLWTLLAFEAWHRVHLRGESVVATATSGALGTATA